MPNKPVFVSPEGRTDDQPWYLDPLNKALGLLPESLARGALAAEEAVTPEFDPTPTSPDYYEQHVLSKLPQEVREFGGFIGQFSQLAGMAPEDVVPGRALVGPALKLRAPGYGTEFAKAKFKEGIRPVQRLTRKDTPSGQGVRRGVAEYVRNPEARFEAMEDPLSRAAGTYTSPEVLQKTRPDLPYAAERVRVDPTVPARTTTHELGHAAWERIGPAQKEAFKEAMEQRRIPEHPKMQWEGYENFRTPPFTASEGEARKLRDAYYNENFMHWYADLVHGEITDLAGKAKPFGAEDLPVVNYFSEFVKGRKVPKDTKEALRRTMGL